MGPAILGPWRAGQTATFVQRRSGEWFLLRGNYDGILFVERQDGISFYLSRQDAVASCTVKGG
jgi:hypothetical protein